MIAVALVTPPHRRCSEHRAALREEIQHHQVLSRQTVCHRRARVLGPALYHPYRLWVDTFHGGKQLASAGRVVNGTVVGTLVERIHRVVASLAVEPGQLLVIEVSDTVKGRIGSNEIGRARIAVPLSAIGHADAHLCLGVVRQHAAVARQHGVHAQRALALQDSFLQCFLLSIPVVGQRSTPPLEIVHRPPGQKSRPGNEASYLFLGIAQLQEHVAPYHFFASDSQWHVDAVQGHPVDLFLPAVPVPKGHGIGKRAVVEVVAVGEPCGATFLALDSGQTLRQAGVHVVPTDHDAGIVLEIPVDPRGDVHPRIAFDTDLAVALRELKEIGI